MNTNHLFSLFFLILLCHHLVYYYFPAQLNVLTSCLVFFKWWKMKWEMVKCGFSLFSPVLSWDLCRKQKYTKPYPLSWGAGWHGWIRLFIKKNIFLHIFYIYISIYLCDEITHNIHFSSFPNVGPKKPHLTFFCFFPSPTMISLNHPEELNPD